MALKVEDVAPNGYAIDRGRVRQKKTGRPVKFELTDQTRQAVDVYLKTAGKKSGDFLFTGRRGDGQCITTRQYARLVSEFGSAGRAGFTDSLEGLVASRKHGSLSGRIGVFMRRSGSNPVTKGYLTALSTPQSTLLHLVEQGYGVCGARDEPAQTRMVSMAGIRLGPWESARAFKGIICHDISEFESYMPSHAVGSF